MLLLFRATTSIVLSWLAWWLVLTGLGLLLAAACGRCAFGRRAGGPPPRPAGDLFAAFWTGWSASLVFLMFWHFLFPVDRRAAALLAAAGLAGLLLQARRGRRAWLRRRARRLTPRGLVLALLFLAVAFWVADHSLLEPKNYDSALYHLSAIRWCATYPIVPGLGLLHGRLAFNQTYFLFVALLDACSWSGRAYHWAAGLLLLPLLARLVLRLASRPRPGEPAVARLFEWLLFVPVLAQVNNLLNLDSPSPDLPAFLISIVLALDLLAILLPAPGPRRALPGRVLRLVALGLVGVTMKFSFVVFGLGYPAVALAIAARRLRGAPFTALRRRLLGGAAALAALILAPWAARDVLLSGWLAYPLQLVSFPVPWRVPPVFVVWERALITGLSRDPLKRLAWPIHGWGWFLVWASRLPERFPFELLVPLGVLFFALCLALIQRRRGVPARNSAALWLFLAVPCAAVVFWFFTAPDPRFAGGAFWILAAAANAFLIERLLPRRRRLARGLVALLLAVTFYFGARSWPLIAPGPERGFYPVRQFPLRRVTTASGLVLFVPTEGDQCYDAPLPCTPYPNPNLRLIVPGDLGGGFVLQGSTPVRPEDLVPR